MNIEISVDFKDVARALSEVAPRQVNFAMAKTLTALAQDGREAILKAMPIKFDRPTGFTLRSPAIEKAEKTKHEARVFLAGTEETTSVENKYEYLQPGVAGASARRQKRVEILLTKMGHLKPGYVTVPGKAMPVDPATGAMAGSTYRWIVNVLQLKRIESKSAKGVYDKSAKRAKKLGVDVEAFVAAAGNRLAAGGGRLPAGVYKRLPGNKLLQMLKFVPRAAYRERLPFAEIVTQAVTANIEKRWAESVDFALLTAKK